MKTEEHLSCEQCRELLNEFAENSLDSHLSQGIDYHLTRCDDCNALLHQLWEMQLLSTQWQDESVPRWPRQATFFEANPFNYKLWLPKLQTLSSLATVLVLIMVLGNTQISTDKGFSIRFGNQDYLTQKDMDAKMAHLENQLKLQQQAQLQRNVSNLAQQQIATSQLLLRTILERSREERQEDLDTVLASWDLTQNQEAIQTRLSIGILLANQVEDRRNINQLNQLLQNASFKGGSL